MDEGSSPAAVPPACGAARHTPPTHPIAIPRPPGAAAAPFA